MDKEKDILESWNGLHLHKAVPDDELRDKILSRIESEQPVRPLFRHWHWAAAMVIVGANLLSWWVNTGTQQQPDSDYTQATAMFAYDIVTFIDITETDIDDE
ncbi:MAG: hypothetical protein OEX02_06965 [Cyclobacteriaceae bacterium]|nr:hypothetical protein [Cyclobacteriaceae bacterium]